MKGHGERLKTKRQSQKPKPLTSKLPEEWLSLREKTLKCEQCPLKESRHKVVFGEGPVPADVMIIGEGPGQEEDTSGRPFVGQAGKFLTAMFIAAQGATAEEVEEPLFGLDGLSIDFFDLSVDSLDEARNDLTKYFYLTNTVLCYRNHPKPSSKEVRACKPRLFEEIYLVDPLLIFTVGSYPIEALTGKKQAITKIAGQTHLIKIPGKAGPIVYPVIPLLHPAFILRDGGTSSQWAKPTFEAIVKGLLVLKKLKEEWRHGSNRSNGEFESAN